HQVELLQDLTSSRKELEAALKEVDGEHPQLNRRSPGGGNPKGRGQGRGGFGGGTALYDSLYLAGDEILKKQQGRKAVILLSDVSNKLPLDKIYDQIEEELRNQYNLGYTPDKPGGGYHKVLVSVKRKNLTVRARDGYYS